MPGILHIVKEAQTDLLGVKQKQKATRIALQYLSQSFLGTFSEVFFSFLVSDQKALGQNSLLISCFLNKPALITLKPLQFKYLESSFSNHSSISRTVRVVFLLESPLKIHSPQSSWHVNVHRVRKTEKSSNGKGFLNVLHTHTTLTAMEADWDYNPCQKQIF